MKSIIVQTPDNGYVARTAVLIDGIEIKDVTNVQIEIRAGEVAPTLVITRFKRNAIGEYYLIGENIATERVLYRGRLTIEFEEVDYNSKLTQVLGCGN
jgi:hypothetical protein